MYFYEKFAEPMHVFCLEILVLEINSKSMVQFKKKKIRRCKNLKRFDRKHTFQGKYKQYKTIFE